MASYTFDQLFYYFGGATTATNSGVVGIADDVVTDSQADVEFEPGVAVTGSSHGDNFYGTYAMPLSGGGTMNLPVLADTWDFYILIPDGFQPTDFNPPNPLVLADIDTVSTYTVCFLPGTGIAVPGGTRAVETLDIGDLIRTAAGQLVPVKWIGRQTVSTRFGPAERLMPVRFAAGSLGDGLPTADLTVTADHGMLVEGVICHAGALVNGTTIIRVPLADMGETYTVYHIETEEHEIILANGARTETFIDNVTRRAFDNFDEFETLYGDVPEMEELPYPRAMSARQVPVWVSDRLQILQSMRKAG
ncbi:Hint domain-containing protein [Nioella ostreopsis]|uniref:Hint domain-containing protein n=1 Tax=Nioella ostreopsis TaxID=2448479 RepID=UPI0013DEE0CD|nr:Hint domain-containing protein [Nioella ostreopsis]